MTWEPGQPVISADDFAQWEEWKRTRKREGQRKRRKVYRRIDYYPSTEALRVIERRTHPHVTGTYSAIIDTLVFAGEAALHTRDD